jgi:hypothetical protein
MATAALAATNYQLHKMFAAQFREVAFSEKYYSLCLRRQQSLEFWATITVASTATGSPLLGLFKTFSWEGLTAFTSAVAVIAWIHKFLKWPEKIQRYSSLHGEYQALLIEFHQVLDDMKLDAVTWQQVSKRYRELTKRARDLYKKDDLALNSKFGKAAEQAVDKQFPASFFALPIDLR